ncbi:MAG: hypothetical protein OEW08_02585 [Gammaproteobacteria bacterium]|nr:hypothetical protein [Gammaproteobacteria bacterium]
MRMRTQWFDKGKPRGAEEIANAMGFICWQIGAERVKKMREAGLDLVSPRHGLHIVTEFLALLAHIADRQLQPRFTAEERQIFVSTLGLKMAETVADNRTDLEGPGEYKKPLIDLLNNRFQEYAELPFENLEPSFAMYRLLASYVCDIVDQKRKGGVYEQVMEVEGNEAYKLLQRGIDRLLDKQQADESMVKDIRGE